MRRTGSWSAAKVSVGVLVHNPIAHLRWHLVERTILSLRLAFPRDDLLVVDNGSSDGSSDALEAFAADGVLIVRNEESNLSPAAGRNLLAGHLLDEGDPDVLVLSDDDVEWDPNARKVLVDVWRRAPKELMVVGAILEPYFPWSIDLGMMDGLPVERRSNVPGAAWTMRARDWADIGGFPVSGDLGEDVQLCQWLVASGYALGQLKPPVARHIGEGYSMLGNDDARVRY